MYLIKGRTSYEITEISVYNDNQYLCSTFYVPDTVPRASQRLSHLLYPHDT